MYLLLYFRFHYILQSTRLLGESSVEGWDQSLCQPEGEDKLWSSHQQLWNETLEEGGSSLSADHVLDDLNTRLWVFEVAVLDAGLDDIEWSGDDQRGGSTSDGGDKVLEPGGLVVVIELEEVTLGESRSTEEGEGAWSVTGSGPSPSTVESKTLIADNADDTTSTESLWVCLTLDLEDIKWQEDDLSDTDEGSGEGGDHGLSGLRAESAVERIAVVLGDEIAGEWLSTILVDTLRDLVTGGITQSWEEGEELLAGGDLGLVLEDDLVELGNGGDLYCISSLLKDVRSYNMRIPFRGWT